MRTNISTLMHHSYEEPTLAILGYASKTAVGAASTSEVEHPALARTGGAIRRKNAGTTHPRIVGYTLVNNNRSLGGMFNTSGGWKCSMPTTLIAVEFPHLGGLVSYHAHLEKTGPCISSTTYDDKQRRSLECS